MLPAKLMNTRRIDQTARSAIGLLRIIYQISMKVYNRSNLFCQFLHGNFFAAAYIDMPFFIIMIHKKDTRICKIIHIEELTFRASRPPKSNGIRPLHFSRMKLANHRRDDM